MGDGTSGFLGDDVLLSGPTARVLFHGTAREAPIVDFHSHLAAADVAGDRVYETLTELWLSEDHYVWRAMRLAGVDEALVTGGADPWDTFSAWAAVMPPLAGNPLHLWGHLGLRRVFDIDLALHPGTAREIWDEANAQLPKLGTRALLGRFGVELLATTDDPADDLAAHRRLREEPEGRLTARVVPTWRPDGAHRLLADPPSWNAWADRLEQATGVAVTDLTSLTAALEATLRRFDAAGARSSDHGLVCVPDEEPDALVADGAVRLARRGVRPAP
ncbi:MAG: glucuronate isomerase, partial [Acidobacteriota bacterium]|nr:glucuronate isomerase [Acidobacteriota bacterium]